MPYHSECLVYPGEYVPLQEAELILQTSKQPGMEMAMKPLVNMNELADCFIIEVAIPGAKREDILVQARDTILSIIVLNKCSNECTGKNLRMHEFDTEVTERHLLLPDNADTAFVRAEYREGILRLHIPKTQDPAIINSNRIIVY